MKKVSILLLLMVLLSCGNNHTETVSDEYQSTQAGMAEAAPPMADKASGGAENTTTVTQEAEKKIIKTADIVFESKNLEDSTVKIKELVKKYRGYITTETSEGNEYQPSLSFFIRVPSESFDLMIADLGKETAYFDRKSIERKDVTEEFIDVESRLKTKKELESRYLEILRQAKNMSDILEIEQKLSSIREEVEATEGRLKYLQNQVAMSSITLHIYKKMPYSASQKESFFSQLGTAFVKGFYNLTDFFIGIIYIWPFIIIISLVFYFFIKRMRKRKQQK